MDETTRDPLILLRHTLHQHPEISGTEQATARRLKQFIAACHPDEIIEELGGNGLAFVFHGPRRGEVLMLRAELDALPLTEDCSFAHHSQHEGAAHKCGHDGHMAILAGVAQLLQRRRLRQGTLILLFQPAEETGAGAKRLIADARFKPWLPDYVFALHNLPGVAENVVAVKDRHITAASVGMKIELSGKTAHAMTPEAGLSPVEALKELHTQLQQLHNPDREAARFSLITTVGLVAGAEDYGVAPGQGALWLTVRAYQDDVLTDLLEALGTLAGNVARNHGLGIAISYRDQFSATVNESVCTAKVRKAAAVSGLPTVELSQCLGFSEDFGRLVACASKGGALFLLGSGKDYPLLHTPEYDFNDRLIEPGIAMFSAIIDDILGFQDG